MAGPDLAGGGPGAQPPGKGLPPLPKNPGKNIFFSGKRNVKFGHILGKCQVKWGILLIFKANIGSRALSFSDSNCCFTCLTVRHSVCLSATSELNISKTRPDSGMVTMDGLYKLAYGLSIGHTPDDVT